MKLFLVERTDKVGYDQYDSFIVAAHGLEDAKDVPVADDLTWPKDMRRVKVTEIGEAKEGTERGVILGSFNAG